MSKFKKVLALVCLLSLALPSAVHAQSYDNPGLGQKPVSAHPQDYKPLGVRAGSFMLHPGVELALEYDDNILATESNTISDTIFHVRPYITAQSNWSRHSLNVRLAADIARYADYDFRDYEDYFLLISGVLDVTSHSSFNYGLDYMQLHEGRNIRSADQGIKPTEYTLTGGNLGYDHTFNRLSIGLSYNMSSLDFDNNVNAEGEIIDNQDRDRDLSSFGIRAGYQFKSDMQAFISAYGHSVDYREDTDRNGLMRDSDGYSINAGVDMQMTGVLYGDVFVSYHNASYDDPTLPDVDGWAGGMGLNWFPTQLTSVSARITSSIEQTTHQYSSGYLRTLYSVRVDHELLRDLQLSAHVSYSDNDYQLVADAPDNARQWDHIWMAGIGVNYFINRSVFLSASYDYSQLESNLPDDGFDRNRLWLVLGLER